jgi:hypothetical protein
MGGALNRARALPTGALLIATVLAPTAWAAPSGAPEKQACVDAATRGQIQRDDLKLGAAAEAFLVCAKASCPSAVRRSCAEWLEDVRAKMPSVTVTLPPPQASSASLLIDDVPAAFGESITLDPGQHVVRVESAAKPSLAESFSLVAGERKALSLRFPTDAPPVSVAVTRPLPLSVWLLGGVAVAGVASWAVLGLVAKSETDRLADTCAPACSMEQRDSAFRTAVAADLSLLVGGLAAIGAGILFVTRPSHRTVAATLRPLPGGVALGGSLPWQ